MSSRFENFVKSKTAFAELPVFNGAGIYKTGFSYKYKINNFDDTFLGLEAKRVHVLSGEFILFGSFTLEPNEEDVTVRIVSQDAYTLNAVGLKNPGIEAFFERLQPSDQYGVSIGTLRSTADLIDCYKIALDKQDKYLAYIEVNLDCPNAVGVDATNRLQTFFDNIKIEKPLVSVKLPPVFDLENLKTIARLLNKYSVDAVVLCNSLKYAAYNGQMCAMAGPALKPISLGQIELYKKYLSSDISIIGCGGVQKREDVLDYLFAGASAVQVTSAVLTGRLLNEIKGEY